MEGRSSEDGRLKTVSPYGPLYNYTEVSAGRAADSSFQFPRRSVCAQIAQFRPGNRDTIALRVQIHQIVVQACCPWHGFNVGIREE
jgi:hypothetical protein